jgi:hypothetical protein
VSRLGDDLQPSGFDQSKVEIELIKQLVEQMAARGLLGEVASVLGLDLHNKKIQVGSELQIGHH